MTNMSRGRTAAAPTSGEAASPTSAASPTRAKPRAVQKKGPPGERPFQSAV